MNATLELQEKRLEIKFWQKYEKRYLPAHSATAKGLGYSCPREGTGQDSGPSTQALGELGEPLHISADLCNCRNAIA